MVEGNTGAGDGASPETTNQGVLAMRTIDQGRFKTHENSAADADTAEQGAPEGLGVVCRRCGKPTHIVDYKPASQTSDGWADWSAIAAIYAGSGGKQHV